jgi:hypothetical protein
MKICSKCKKEKSVDCFGKNKARRGGLQAYCRECDRKSSAEYRLSNPKHAKEWRLANKEQISATHKEWVLANPERIRNIDNARRARQMSNPVFEVATRDLKKLYSSPCFYCGSFNSIQADHVIPIIKGGRHSIGNLVPACAKCNRNKGTKLLIEWRVWKSNLK